MPINNVFLPTNIFFSSSFTDHRYLAIDNILVIASRSLPTQTLRTTINFFCTDGFGDTILFKTAGEPNSLAIEKLRDQINKCFEAVIAIGGGSVIDTAKAIALLSVSGGKITDYEFGNREIIGALPVYAVPTTCGSGSEVTPYCVITNSATGRKFTITNNALRPTIAYINTCFLKKLPKKTLLYSALDAFTHNLETLLNIQGNVLINPLATEGLRLIYQNLEAVLQKPDFVKGQRRLAMAALYGGISITHSRTGLVHTMSVALAEFCKEPHGLLNAKLLHPVLRFNQNHYNGKLAVITSNFTDRNFCSDYDAMEYIGSWLRKLLGTSTLSANKVIAAQKTHIVDRVMQDEGLPYINAAAVNRISIGNLLREIINEY